MLANLLNVPHSGEDWSRWSFHHRQSHDAIRKAIRDQIGKDLPDYVLDPISDYAPMTFLQNNYNAHVDMNGALNRPSSDLEEVDFNSPGQMQVWIYLHWQEHNVAENTLKIAS